MNRTYILINVDNPDSTFTIKGEDGNIIGCEIYIINLLEVVSTNKIILNALSQSDAFRQFKKSFPSLLKKTTKKYYEKELRF